MYLTYYGANSWLMEFDQLRILVDPWLVGSLVFGNMNWLFKGDRQQPVKSIPENIDLILLSQGLEDHAHRPTLKTLDRSLPVIASPNGAKVAQDLGYTHVTSLAPGESTTFQDALEIRALSGAPIGLQVENGYWLKHLPSDTTLYYEPHGFPPSDLDNLGSVDVAISPVVSLELPVVGALIQGNKTAIEIAKTLNPQVFLPTAAGGGINYQGLLNEVLNAVGSGEEFREKLHQAELATQFIDPKVQTAFEVPLATRAST